MPITAQLAAAGPHLLKYLLTQSVASATASPLVALTFTNQANQATPDLRTDATTGRTNAGVTSAPLLGILRSRIDGFPMEGIAAAAQTQAQARARLASDQVGALLTDPHALSAELFVTPRGDAGVTSWSADASVDASGDPVVVVRTRTIPSTLPVANRRAILTIRCRHTINL